QDAFSRLFIVNRDLQLPYSVYHHVPHFFTAGVLDTAASGIDNGMAAPCVKAGDRPAVTHADRVLGLDPVIHWVFHPDDRIYMYPPEAAYPFAIVCHDPVPELKMHTIGHMLQAAAAASFVHRAERLPSSGTHGKPLLDSRHGIVL